MSSSHGLPGRFIVLEGIDGSGSTTHTKLLSKALRKDGHEVRTSCEPTGGPVGGLIRQVLQRRLMVADGDTVRPFAWSTMALLFAADRLDHLDSLILPALQDGAIVLSDRYDLSSLAYQSATAPGGAEVVPWIRELNARAMRPDLTIVLDVSADVAEERRGRRGGAEELFEKREIQARLARLYLEAEALVPGDKLVHVPGDGEIDSTAALIREVLRRELQI
ncbi:MAG: dTMP kinase [Polyangiaceae bacterium]